MCVKDVTLLKLIVTPKIRNVTCACDPAPTLMNQFIEIVFRHVFKKFLNAYEMPLYVISGLSNTCLYCYSVKFNNIEG